MTYEEILNYINYHGIYTKEVKTKIKKLLKKYHPDKNKKDHKTIILLYDIKKKLEDGTLIYNYDESDVVIEEKNVYYTYSELDRNSLLFINKMINSLKRKRDTINKKIRDLYEVINNYYEKNDVKQDELNNIMFRIKELEENNNSIMNIDIIDCLIGLFIIIFGSIVYIFRWWIFIIMISLMVILEIYYYYLRYYNYISNKSKLEILKEKASIIEEEYQEIKKEIDTLKIKETQLKKEKMQIANDLQFYNYEMNKIIEKGSYSEKNSKYTKNYEKSR